MATHQPSTPPGAVHQEPPPAPRHVTRGRLDENHRPRRREPSPRVGRTTRPARLDTSTMDRAAEDRGHHEPATSSNRVNGRRPLRPVWQGPQAVSGQVASLDDPFVSGTLTASAPAFVPATNNHQAASLAPASVSTTNSQQAASLAPASASVTNSQQPASVAPASASITNSQQPASLASASVPATNNNQPAAHAPASVPATNSNQPAAHAPASVSATNSNQSTARAPAFVPAASTHQSAARAPAFVPAANNHSSAARAPAFVPATNNHQSAARAPAFVPAKSNRQSASPEAGSSSSPGGDSADGGASNGTSSNGDTSRDSSANDSGGADASSPGNEQSSDSPDPVIVTTPYPGGNGMHAIEDDVPAFVITRFLRVDNVYAAHFEENQPLGMIKALPIFKELVQKLGVFAIKPDAAGGQKMLLFVDTLHGSKSLHDMLQMTHRVQYITCKTFRAANVTIPETIDRLSAEIDFTVSIKGKSRARRFSIETVVEMAKGAAAKFGMILHFELVDNSEFAQDGRLKFKIEYNSVGDANDAVHTTNPADGVKLPFGTHEHLYIRARGYEPIEVDSPAGQASEVPQTPSSRPTGSAGSVDVYSKTGRTGTRKSANGKTANLLGYVLPKKIDAPSKPTQAMPLDSQNGTIFETVNPDMFAMILPDGSPHPASAKPQDVCEHRIVNGYDVRTTLMVRNVPPEMTGADFVKILQSTVPGEFDFAYNRIDFQKSQSVGYAFVNFVTTEALLRFVHTWRGKLLPHNIYRQHLRPCAVSYANTQGWDCLVAKFRNSSILEEAKHCRPLLFWSVESAKYFPHMIGLEREWPEVNNASKKNRSVENAKISGLYTPRPRVNGGRGSGRRGGHTRFDRGTTAQQHEENQMGFVNYQHGAGPAPVYGPYAQPRFEGPPMLYDWHTSQLVPPPAMGYPPMPFPTQPMMQPSPVQGSALRTHTRGDLGYRHPVMAAQLAPVSDPSQAQDANQDEFQPLLHPIKGQVPTYYRAV